MPIKMKVCNHTEYTQSLKKRGHFFSFFEKSLDVWFYNKVEQCRSSKFMYSNQLIDLLALLRYLLKLPFRQLAGALEEYVTRIKRLNLPIPDYTTLCRRMKKQNVTLCDNRTLHQKQSGEPIEVLIDSTAINIYHASGGHRKINKRTRKKSHYDQVRKRHISFDPESKMVLSMKMTSGTGHDCLAVHSLLEPISDTIRGIYADSAYDTNTVRRLCFLRNAKQLIPPKRTSTIRKSIKGDPPHLWDERNAAISIMNLSEAKEVGLKTWKSEVGYGKRALVEGLFSRLKRLFGFHFMSKNEQTRLNELTTKLNILNAFNQFPQPIFEKVV